MLPIERGKALSLSQRLFSLLEVKPCKEVNGRKAVVEINNMKPKIAFR
jgi:hypothetical protein